MKRKILMSLVMFGCLNPLFANDTVDWDKEEQLETQLKQKEEMLKKQQIKSKMLLTEAIVIAQDTIDSLEKNLEFFQKIQSSKEYRECTIIKTYIENINKDRNIADELYQEKEVTKKQYTIYISKLNATQQSLQNKIDQKKCK